MVVHWSSLYLAEPTMGVLDPQVGQDILGNMVGGSYRGALLGVCGSNWLASILLDHFNLRADSQLFQIYMHSWLLLQPGV